MLYADLILPLPLPGVFTYSVPEKMSNDAAPGKRVLVQFGKRKIYPAIICALHDKEPSGYRVRDIISILDDDPVVLPVQLTFWKWIASYYMCAEGEVMKAAMPSGMKPESETRLAVNPQFSTTGELGEKEAMLFDLIENNPDCTIRQLSVAAGGLSVYHIVKSLVDHNAILAKESLKTSWKPKTETFIKLHSPLCNATSLNSIADSLNRAPRQLEILYHYLHISGYSKFSDPAPEIPKTLLMDGIKASPAALHALLKKKILVEVRHQTSRLVYPETEKKGLNPLNKFQAEAISKIEEQFKTRDVVLLNGVTSGGKTEIYMHLINQELKKGRQVLYLLPEIALTTQIIVRLKQVFGDDAGVYHSRFSDAERVEIWKNVLKKGSGSYRLILGVRSSVFLPFSDLGLVIVDEEYENTFKQFDPAPRYHARDAAIMLASMQGAKTLLGTATPSVESGYNALSGKYGFVSLKKRYQEIELPEIIIANTREARKRKKMKSIFTTQLLDAIEEALDNGEQVILFQNRRGYAPYMECTACDWIPMCRSCDVSMTWHKSPGQLVCHYCGDTGNISAGCLECGNPELAPRGFGTEKIEDEISIFFPKAKVGRLDLDSVRKKSAHERIIGDFEAGNIDILAGTQMIAKGLDFGKVSLVGILNADNLLFFPDFRAHERSFQLICQVSGRAGRKAKRGKVVIQTGFPDHPVIRDILNNNPERHFNELLAERKKFRYPPYVRLIRITIKDKSRELVRKAASELADKLRKKFGSRVLGPEFPLIGRIQNRFLMNILLKIEKGADHSRARLLIRNEIGILRARPDFRSCFFIPDVDPA